MRTMGNAFGSVSVNTMGWALYVSPAVPVQVPVSGKVNCGVIGGARSPCSSAISRIVRGTHSDAEPIVICTPSESWDPDSTASVAVSVSFPCVHVTGAAPIAVELAPPILSEDDAVELADDDAKASVDVGVELATAVLVLPFPNMPASEPFSELTTYVPLPL